MEVLPEPILGHGDKPLAITNDDKVVVEKQQLVIALNDTSSNGKCLEGTADQQTKNEKKVLLDNSLSSVSSTSSTDANNKLATMEFTQADVNEIKKSTTSMIKTPEIDSLVLTADDELETEMLLSEKGKNDNRASRLSKNSNVAENDKNSMSEDNFSILNNVDKKSAITEQSKSHTCAARSLWISNITHSIKATELKQFMSKVGKVITAKIVTDGKKCYGYVVMDNNDDASECVKILNNTTFEEQKITVSFSRPSSGDDDKGKDLPKTSDEKKSKKQKPAARKNRDSSRTRSLSLRRRRSRDPLTTKFDGTDRACSKEKSRSVDRCSTDFLRDKLERDRLRRCILEEQRRSRIEMMREMHREEKQRELEFRLERERRKLQLERELFERERRELYRIDAERRKIEKERLEIMQERTKLAKEYQKSRRQNDDFNLNSTIVKPHNSLKVFDKSKPKGHNTSTFRSIDSKHDRNSSDSKGPHRNALKDDFKLGKENRERSTSRRGEDLKNYERLVPPPPKLNNDFEMPPSRKLKHQDFKRDEHGERKTDYGGRKIEVIDRKYYPDRSRDNGDRKNDNIYRKPEFDDRKTYNFSERKYDYGHDGKRPRIGEFQSRDPIRNQWYPSSNYTEPWKTGMASGSSNSPVRYQNENFSAPSYGGVNRMPTMYYHSGPTTQEYQRYDHNSQNTGRKY